jgi:DNA polymerase III subunit delta'
MPFTADTIEEKIETSFKEGRMGHAYLLTGHSLEELEGTFYRIAAGLLKSDNQQHPDLHIVRPESKSRRLKIEQMRQLEKQLQLKPYQANIKVAGVIAADRMCLPPAEAANAFLKTLEEPPDRSVIFLLTNAPEMLLPTIKSRCLHLPVQTDTTEQPIVGLDRFLDAWFQIKGDKISMAYARARLFSDFCLELREQVESTFEEQDSEDDEETVVKAQIESIFLFQRDRVLGALIQAVWNKGNELGRPESAAQMCEALDELRYAFQRNIEAALATERCCLKMTGAL